MYHKVAPECPTLWWVTADAFDRQMSDLAAYKVVPLDDYNPNDPRHVAITFDGVYDNVYRFAFPILRKWGYPFELFVIGEQIGHDNAFDAGEPAARFCTAGQLQEMARGGGRVQWHTRTHRPLAELEDEALDWELSSPSALREQFAPPHLSWFAYPHGEHDGRVVDAVRRRFNGALSCNAGSSSDKHQLNRLTVLETTRFGRSKVSVIIPNYNYGTYLPRAIQSALDQSMDADEILVIDDASTDGSVEIANHYGSRVKVVVNESNLGIVKNFRKAVELTSGDYVAILGADNVMRSDYVERCKAALDQNPDAAIAYTDMSIFGPRAAELAERVSALEIGESVLGKGSVYVWRFPEPTKDALDQLPTKNFMHGSSMFRRSAYDGVGGYRESAGPEDHDLFRRMIAAGSRAVRVPHALIFYRQHSATQANTALLIQEENSSLRLLLARARAEEATVIEALRKDRDRLASDLEAMRGDRDRLARDVEEMRTDRDRLAHDLHVMQSDRDRTIHDLEDIRIDRDRIADDLVAMRANRDKIGRDLSEILADRERVIADLQAVGAERDELAARPRWLVTSSMARGALPRLRRIARQGLARGYRGLPRRVQNLLDGLRRKHGRSSVFESSQNQFALMDLSSRRSSWSRDADRLILLPQAPFSWPDLDVSLVTYNNARWLKNFFESLLAQNYPLERIHFRAVDHGSNDESVRILEEFSEKEGARFGSVAVLQRKNLGFGNGHNFAISEGSAEYILVTNADVSFEAETLSSLVSTAVADDGMTASWEARQKPFEHPKYYDPVTGEVNWSSHALVLMRREAYQAVGGYDRHIFMYGEDVELSYRFRRHGYRLRYVPRAVVWHHTYSEANEVKALQFRGSTLANSLLRLRYGTIRDALTGVSMLTGLLFQPEAYPGSRADVARNVLQYIAKFPFFIPRARSSRVWFPFRGWDYDMVRDGAFVGASELPENPPLVSVVIRTYRGREHILRQAIASALQQTYPAVEVVVVEDGGTEMKSVVEAFHALTTRPILYQGLEKVGRSAAGNVGLSRARGDYINFLDDDDLLFADHIETLVSALGAEPASRASYGLAWQVYSRFEKSYAVCKEDLFETPDIFRQPFSAEVLEHHNFIPIQACLFERSLFEERGGFDQKLDALEDWNLWLRYSHGESFVYVPKVTSLFRVPADVETRRARGMVLHEAYELAKQRAADAVAETIRSKDDHESRRGGAPAASRAR